MIKKFLGITPKEIWNLRGIARNLGGKAITIPADKDVTEALNDCIFILPGIGRVNFEFAKWVLIGWEYSQTVHHYQSGQSLLDDIKSGKKRIFFNSYI